MSDKNTEEAKNPQPKTKMREILIQTDGNNINIVKSEVAGNLELMAILSSILNKLQNTSSTR